ncbi:TPA: hypothetical protein I7730_01025 [Vibrio vulnificus]|uniref:Uncharacterized protein n=1 Tax=Vibrio vulnificus TaxID=672 RepID=A0A8H9MY69_VIBVL|nr:hypothetical protein [Vibrio vulnificus]
MFSVGVVCSIAEMQLRIKCQSEDVYKLSSGLSLSTDTGDTLCAYMYKMGCEMVTVMRCFTSFPKPRSINFEDFVIGTELKASTLIKFYSSLKLWLFSTEELKCLASLISCVSTRRYQNPDLGFWGARLLSSCCHDGVELFKLIPIESQCLLSAMNFHHELEIIMSANSSKSLPKKDLVAVAAFAGGFERSKPSFLSAATGVELSYCTWCLSQFRRDYSNKDAFYRVKVKPILDKLKLGHDGLMVVGWWLDQNFGDENR